MTLVELLPFAAIAAAFWLLIIRPASVRRKAQAALVASLAPGQQIMTTAGVFATVISIEAERVRVEIAPGVVIEMLAAAIARVVPASEEAPEHSTPPVADTGAAPGDPGGADDATPPAPTQEAERG